MDSIIINVIETTLYYFFQKFDNLIPTLLLELIVNLLFISIYEITLIAFIATWVILFRYLKEKYIDLLKIIQLSFIIVNWLNYILIITTGFINNKTAFQCLFVFAIFFETFEAIYLSSQISWFTLALHLQEYRLMVEGKSYIEWNKFIKAKEKKVFITIGLAWILYQITVFFLI